MSRLNKVSKSVLKEIIETFNIFPKRINSLYSKVDNLKEVLPYDMLINLELSEGHPNYISLEVDNVGRISKYFDYDETPPYILSYYKKGNPEINLWTDRMTNDRTIIITKSILPYMCSRGNNKKTVPEIVSVFPKLAELIFNCFDGFENEKGYW